MARYVLVEFDSNEVADEFVAATKVEGAVFIMGTDGHFKNIDPGNYGVRGLFGKPTKFCECPSVEGEEPVSARGKKWGWWVHRKCGKPRKGNCQHPRNLLEPEDMDPKRRDLYLGVYEPELKAGDPTPEFKFRNR